MIGGVRMRKKWIWITFSLIVLVAVIIVVSWKGLSTSAEAITKEEARSIIEERYLNSKVTNINLQKDAYRINMTKDNGEYEVALNAENGEILSLKKVGKSGTDSGENDENNENDNNIINEKEIEKILLESSDEILSLERKLDKEKEIYVAKVKENKEEFTIKVDAETGSIVSKDKVERPKEENAQKAISKEEAVKIALEYVNGTVDDDIETENIGGQTYYLIEIETDDDREATVQVHAITGKATISYDD